MEYKTGICLNTTELFGSHMYHKLGARFSQSSTLYY